MKAEHVRLMTVMSHSGASFAFVRFARAKRRRLFSEWPIWSRQGPGATGIVKRNEKRIVIPCVSYRIVVALNETRSFSALVATLWLIHFNSIARLPQTVAQKDALTIKIILFYIINIPF